MDRLVAHLSVAGIPDQMPVVVKPVLGKRFQRRRACPQLIIHAGRNGFLGSVPNRGPPFVAKRAGQVDVTDRAVSQMLHGFQHAWVGSPLAAVLADSVVLLHCSH